jgi:hypothetical protein
MKLFELVGLFLFISFVANCLQFESKRKECEKTEYKASGCEIHKDLKQKKLKISFE